MVADQFKRPVAQQRPAVGIKEVLVAVPMPWVGDRIDHVASDDDRTGFSHRAAERKWLSRQLVQRLDGHLGACGAPFIEVNLRVG